jgi:hypothetical protein
MKNKKTKTLIVTHLLLFIGRSIINLWFILIIIYLFIWEINPFDSTQNN